MRIRALTFPLLVLAVVLPLDAHVGSPDVFFEGNAGPYHLFVTVRMPQVIPGIAEIDVRSESKDARTIAVVPLRLTGQGSKFPPTPDVAQVSKDDPQFFTASLWLMEFGALQVRVLADGALGKGELSVPVPSYAQRSLRGGRCAGRPTGMGFASGAAECAPRKNRDGDLCSSGGRNPLLR